MPEEHSLYLSEREQIAAPSFARHCRYFRGRVVQELFVREDGTGIRLKAGDRSVDLVYKPGSFNMALLGRFDTPGGSLHMFPTGKEGEIRKYIPAEDIEEARIAVGRPNVIKDIIATLHEGGIIEEAVLETRRSIIINMKEPRIPRDTAFFAPSPIPIRFIGDELNFYMEPNSFVMAVCEGDGQTTVYVPKEADR